MSLRKPLISLLMAAGPLLVALAAQPAGAAPSAPPQLPAAAATAQPAPAATSNPVTAPRIMLYGDSLTHGFNADWTWRYRLWQSLKASGQDFDFVGPRDDVVEYTVWKPDSQGYRNPGFDRDHASLAGMKFLNGYYQPGPLAEAYRPHVIVAFIAANDLLKTTDVAGLIPRLRDHWRDQIGKARRADRGVDFVLVPIPHTWMSGAAEYNTVLNEVATQLDTVTERVIVAPQASLGRWTDTFDQAHLSASGQAKIAAVVDEGLARLGIGTGTSAAIAADPPDDNTWAPQPTATVAGTTATVTWPAVTYASSQNVWARDRETGVAGLRQFVAGTSTTLTGVAGHSYDVWLEPVKGFLPIGTRSSTIRVDIPAS